MNTERLASLFVFADSELEAARLAYNISVGDKACIVAIFLRLCYMAPQNRRRYIFEELLENDANIFFSFRDGVNELLKNTMELASRRESVQRPVVLGLNSSFTLPWNWILIC